MRISDWSSDVCSSDLLTFGLLDSADQLAQPPDGGVEPRGHRASELLKLGVLAPRRLQGFAQRLVVATGGRRALCNARSHNLLQAVDRHLQAEIGRASCRERVCQYV